jgi:hypothetical protein
MDLAVGLAGVGIRALGLRHAWLAAAGRAGDLADRALGLDGDLRVQLAAEQRGDHHGDEQQAAQVLGGDLAGGAREARAQHPPHVRRPPPPRQEPGDPTCGGR